MVVPEAAGTTLDREAEVNTVISQLAMRNKTSLLVTVKSSLKQLFTLNKVV